jgi:hypothetical protein
MMTSSFCPERLAVLALAAPPRLAKIFRVIPRASAETRAPASSGLSAEDVTVSAAAAAGPTAGAADPIVVDVHPVARDSNAVAPAARGTTAAIKAAIPARRAALS